MLAARCDTKHNQEDVSGCAESLMSKSKCMHVLMKDLSVNVLVVQCDRPGCGNFVSAHIELFKLVSPF
jgi:hypothetical protein